MKPGGMSLDVTVLCIGPRSKQVHSSVPGSILTKYTNKIPWQKFNVDIVLQMYIISVLKFAMDLMVEIHMGSSIS